MAGTVPAVMKMGPSQATVEAPTTEAQLARVMEAATVAGVVSADTAAEALVDLTALEVA